jgi:hypothetical protein
MKTIKTLCALCVSAVNLFIYGRTLAKGIGRKRFMLQGDCEGAPALPIIRNFRHFANNS